MKLLDRWDAVHGRSDIPTRIYNEIYHHYSSEQRAHHNLQHLEECFEEFDFIKNKLEKPKDVALAIWFHDIIYNPLKTDNEELSAQRFKANFKYVMNTLNTEKLILATKEHKPYDNDSAYFLDIDMSIIGKSEKRFNEYEKGIRQEYHMYSDEIYNPERKKILKSFLDEKQIFTTEYFHTKFEDQAKTNIKGLIKKLS